MRPRASEWAIRVTELQPFEQSAAAAALLTAEPPGFLSEEELQAGVGLDALLKNADKLDIKREAPSARAVTAGPGSFTEPLFAREIPPPSAPVVPKTAPQAALSAAPRSRLLGPLLWIAGLLGIIAAVQAAAIAGLIKLPWPSALGGGSRPPDLADNSVAGHARPEPGKDGALNASTGPGGTSSTAPPPSTPATGQLEVTSDPPGAEGHR